MEMDQRMARKLDTALKKVSTARAEVHKRMAELLEANAQVTGFRVELASTKAQLDDLHKCIGLAEPEAALLVTSLLNEAPKC